MALPCSVEQGSREACSLVCAPSSVTTLYSVPFITSQHCHLFKCLPCALDRSPPRAWFQAQPEKQVGEGEHVGGGMAESLCRGGGLHREKPASLGSGGELTKWGDSCGQQETHVSREEGAFLHWEASPSCCSACLSVSAKMECRWRPTPLL